MTGFFYRMVQLRPKVGGGQSGFMWGQELALYLAHNSYLVTGHRPVLAWNQGISYDRHIEFITTDSNTQIGLRHDDRDYWTIYTIPREEHGVAEYIKRDYMVLMARLRFMYKAER